MRGRTTDIELAEAIARNTQLRLKRPAKALGSPDPQGNGKLQAGANVASARHTPQPRRDYKEELRDQLRVAGVPDPDTEFCFHPTRKWRWDFCWPDKLVAVEYQGGIYNQGKQGHQTTVGIERDCLKFSWGAALGWRLLPINAGMVRDGTALDLIIRALYGKDHIQ